MSRPRLVLSALVATAALAAPALTACTTTSTVNRPLTTVGASRPDGSGVRVDALAELLGSRFRAVERGDRTSWQAALAPGVSQADRAAQGRIFDRMLAMGVTDLRVVSVTALPAARPTSPLPTPAPPVTATTATTRPDPSSSTTTGKSATTGEWRARLTATYRLDGFDRAPRTFAIDLTLDGDRDSADLTTSPTSPAADSGATPSADLGSEVAPLIRAWTPAERPQPWDLEGLRIRRTADALLLVVGSDARLAELAHRTHAAAGRVAAVWGAAEPSVWVAPGTDADAARLLGRAADAMADVAAVTDGPLEPGEQAGADRIVVVPTAWAGLSGDGRDVVLTHELTHASVRASTTRAVPSWLAEGFAELVAYRSIRLPEREIVAPALDLVRTAGLPETLPTDTDFTPAAGRLQAAYGLSLLAVRTLAEQHGTPALVRLYREAAGALPAPTAHLGDAEAITDLALEQVGTDRSTLVRHWRARIAALLGP